MVVTELDTRSGNVMVFSTNYECDGYFKGLLTEPSGNVEECYISKEDFTEAIMTERFAETAGRWTMELTFDALSKITEKNALSAFRPS